MNISFKNNQLTVGDSLWTVERPVVAARILEERVFVVFDWMTYKPNYAPAYNLEAFDLDRNRLWRVSEHPISGGALAYTGFAQSDDLLVYHFAGYVCQFDPCNGKLLESVFTK